MRKNISLTVIAVLMAGCVPINTNIVTQSLNKTLKNESSSIPVVNGGYVWKPPIVQKVKIPYAEVINGIYYPPREEYIIVDAGNYIEVNSEDFKKPSVSVEPIASMPNQSTKLTPADIGGKNAESLQIGRKMDLKAVGVEDYTSDKPSSRKKNTSIAQESKPAQNSQQSSNASTPTNTPANTKLGIDLSRIQKPYYMFTDDLNNAVAFELYKVKAPYGVAALKDYQTAIKDLQTVRYVVSRNAKIKIGDNLITILDAYSVLHSGGKFVLDSQSGFSDGQYLLRFLE